ncbi:MAG: hypothetical protein H5U19_07425 [Rhodobacteraceae bacterium]|nr:hypothetical protein [Paracoccaceae bacterium]
MIPGVGFSIPNLAQRRRAGVAQTMEATGGNSIDIAESGTAYRVHRFDSSGVLSVTQGGTAEVLVLAGGGGGSTAGGGAGGVILTQVALTPGDWPVVVGTGGAGIHGGATPRPVPASRGGNSTFAGLVALGGGPGSGTDSGSNGTGDTNGGSGGGGGSSSQPAKFVTVKGAALQPGSSSGGLGHDGGDTTIFVTPFYAGGGGGAGAPAPDAGGTWAPGGAGITTMITGSPQDVGGGGAGGRWDNGTGLAGTHGGGGGGSGNLRDAAPNTGGGGGGGSSTIAGGKGGSGLVIIRYRI